MRFLYYAMAQQETADAVIETLKRMGIRREACRVIRNNSQRISEQTRQEGQRGALVGAMCGLLFVLWIMVMKPMGLVLGLTVFLGFSLGAALCGAWIGRMLGMSSDNDGRVPLQDLVSEQWYRVIIGVAEGEAAKEVRRVLQYSHPDAAFEAEDIVAWNTPLSQAKLKRHHS